MLGLLTMALRFQACLEGKRGSQSYVSSRAGKSVIFVICTAANGMPHLEGMRAGVAN